MMTLAPTPCTPVTETGIRNGGGHRHRNGTAGTDPQRDGRGKPAESPPPDNARRGSAPDGGMRSVRGRTLK